MDACSPCLGTDAVSTNAGALSCTACPTGKTANSAKTSCGELACKHRIQLLSFLPVDCSYPFSFKNLPVISIHKSLKNIVTDPCPRGTYKDSSMSECKRCAENTVSDGGAVKCQHCSPGTVAGDDRVACCEYPR